MLLACQLSNEHQLTLAGYVMANVAATTLKSMTALGMSRVRNALIDTLARTANVSAFRVPVDELYVSCEFLKEFPNRRRS